MKYIDEYRDKKLVKGLIEKIHSISTKPVKLMEVCGGHTMAIQKFGIRHLLPETVKLVSGPGCPVCVSDIRFIDTAIAYSRLENVIIATFGDLIRVPGSTSSLAEEKATGGDIRIIFSPFDAIKLAQQNTDKKVVLLGIGFETTAPGTALTILEANKLQLENFFVLSSHKIMPPAMKALIDEQVGLDGYLAPGHVSTITGADIYDFIAHDYHLPVVIAGFEPVDMLQSIYLLVKQLEENRAEVEIQYKRVVKKEGNTKARKTLNNVFTLRDEWWRGLGILPQSGLQIGSKYEQFDAEKQIKANIEAPKEPKGCICGAILKGLKDPKDCPLFGKACTPEKPVGACMVSNEGACHASFKYNVIE